MIFGTIEQSPTESKFWDVYTINTMRKFFSYGLLSVTILWLVVSYIPESILVLPKTSLEWLIPNAIQQGIFVLIMVCFVGIQLSLVISTNSFFANKQDLNASSSNERIKKFGLKRGPELFWTSVPVAMTVVTLLLTYTVFSQ